MAKTVRMDSKGHLEWGGSHDAGCAHKNESLNCIACHSSWNPSCFGCHLPQKANMKMPNLHFEVIVGGVPVTPLQWFDGGWIQSHIEDPLAQAEVDVREGD